MNGRAGTVALPGALGSEEFERQGAELRKLQKINRVLMDRVERDMDSHGGNAYALFRTAITLETQVSERTAELAKLTHQLMQEISQRRQAEKALLAAKAEAEQANLGKTRFLAAATHDLYQPLNAARLFVGALADEPPTPRSRELLGRIDAALDTVDELLGALLDISKLDAGAWPVSLTDVAIAPMLARLAEEYRPQAHQAGLELRIVRCSAIVRTDRCLFERALRNLISNAIRYTAEGRILIGCRRRGRHVAVQVWDSGIGIPEPMRRVIFAEFQRLGPAPRGDGKGLGLGLAIVDRIARLLDIDIEVASIVGRGSCFSLTVAASADGIHDESAVAAAAEPAGIGSKCVALIDNDEAVLAGMRAVIDGWGCRLIAAVSGEKALAALEAAGAVPDLVVADYHLDDGASGAAAIAAIRMRYGQDLPALVISGDHSAEVRGSLKAAGMPFLPKPATPARLRAMMSYLVNPPAAR
jgi:signal transduction histidine kinase/CheY-like chemotaxis protein